MRVIKRKGQLEECHFHFKGVCAGESLREVILLKPGALTIKKGEEYLMYVQFLSCEDGILRGKILKAKPLEECWDNS
jgi:hypothetical protein